MGVPKFFRWISARYPCINQVLRPGEVPVIDHFYLDMNGILHTCSHPEGNKTFISEEAIFRYICLYVQSLFNLIKPRKTFFLAVDGVAPRAKMTQQRARRFQSALEGRIAKENLNDTNVFDPCVISPGTEFMDRLHRHLVAFVEKHVNHDADWQCIDVILSGHDCPGEGEHKIREYMAYRRCLPDYRPNERHCIYGMDADLIFLGLTTHETNCCILRENVVKAQSFSVDNKPFCITYLSVLREYIDLEFAELKKTLSFPYDLERIIDDWVFMAFLLGNDFIPHIPNLHIHAESLLTVWDTYQVVLPKLDGYLVEFGYLNLPRFHKYLEELSQFERDWFEEREAAFHWMRGKQGARMANELEKLGISSEDNQVPSQKPSSPTKKHFSKINEGTSLDMRDGIDQLTDLTHLFIQQQPDSQYDNVIIDEAAELMEEGVVVSLMSYKDKTEQFVNKSNVSGRLSCGKLGDIEDSLEVDADEGDVEVDDDDANCTESDTDVDEDLLVYKMHRRDYYSSKLGIQLDEESSDHGENSKLMSLIQDYVKMLQWILNYYFLHVADWDFYYAYHYAPFVHDLILYTKKYENCQETFNSIKLSWTNFHEDSQPVLPFVQQLMILPPDSAYIVPPPYWELMISQSSPLAEFFPKEFETDINGKTASWEAVVLIPFVDQEQLINAMKDGNAKLTDKEKERNQHKSHLFYRACPIGRVKPPVELVNYDFYRKCVNCSESHFRRFYASVTRYVVEDFPSLLRLPFTYKIQKIPVCIFECPSKLDSLALTMKPHPVFSKYDNLGQLATSILGRPIRVRWPFCATVMPVRLMNSSEIWELVDFNVDPLINSLCDFPSKSLRSRPISSSKDNNSELIWLNNQLSSLKHHFQKRRAILFDSTLDMNNDDHLTIHVNLASSSVLVFSRPLDGWSLVPIRTNTSNCFSLSPNFIRSRAHNGDELELFSSPFSSAFVHSENMNDFPGKHGKKLKTPIEKPSMSIEPAFGLSDGLNLDLLDLILPEIPPPPSIGCVEVDWSYDKPIPLHTIFHPGKIVFNLAKKNYGSAGEVVAVDEKKGKVKVRFYPNFSSTTDLTEFRSQVDEWEHDEFYTNIMVANQLDVPVYVVNRLTGSLMIEVIPGSRPSNGNNSNDIHNHVEVKSDNITKGNKFEENAENGKEERKSFTNIGLNLKRSRSGAQVLGWSRFCTVRHTWLFSNRTVDLLKNFRENFPNVWEKVSKSSSSSERNHSCIKLDSKEVEDIMEFISNSECRNAPVLPQKGIYLDKEWLQKLKYIYLKDMSKTVCEPFDRKSWSKSPPVDCSPTSLFISVNSDTRIYPSSYNLSPYDRCYYSSNYSSVFSSFTLLDKVIFIGIGHNIPLGLQGIVIGVPCGVSSQKSEQPLEILFCRTFTDAIDIRGSGPCCALVRPSLLLRLPEKTNDNKQSNFQPKSNRPFPKAVPNPWLTKGPIRNYQHWPTNKSDQNVTINNNNKKMENVNRGHISMNNSSVHSSSSSTAKAKEKLKQQNVKTENLSSIGNDITKIMQEPFDDLLSDTNSTLRTASQGKASCHPHNVIAAHNKDDSNSLHDAEDNSFIWTMPSPPDVPLPPSYWSNNSKSTSGFEVHSKIKDVKNTNPQKKKNVCWSDNNVLHSGNSDEYSHKNFVNRPDRSSHNKGLCLKTPIEASPTQNYRPNFGTPNASERPNFNPCIPRNQIRPVYQSTYQPGLFLQDQSIRPPPVYGVNRYPSMMPPYAYTPGMYEPPYVVNSPYQAFPEYQLGFINRQPIPCFPLMSNAPTQVCNPTMNYGSTNRLCIPQMQGCNQRDRSRSSSRVFNRYDLPSQPSNSSYHSSNQSRCFVPPQVSRMRRP
ncbi:5'-3' exoribonuclease 1 [Schistosoma japonicum]|nr:5'-3' exoribonuclease 1 [Schistosoma japonicum]